MASSQQFSNETGCLRIQLHPGIPESACVLSAPGTDAASCGVVSRPTERSGPATSLATGEGVSIDRDERRASHSVDRFAPELLTHCVRRGRRHWESGSRTGLLTQKTHHKHRNDHVHELEDVLCGTVVDHLHDVET